jgi:hypothetical protein
MIDMMPLTTSLVYSPRHASSCLPAVVTAPSGLKMSQEALRFQTKCESPFRKLPMHMSSH